MGNGRDLQVEFSMHIHTTFQVNLEKLRETITPGTQPRGQDRVPADRGQPDSGDLRSRPWSAGARDNPRSVMPGAIASDRLNLPSEHACRTRGGGGWERFGDRAIR